MIRVIGKYWPYLLALGFACLHITPIVDPDCWWHVALGESIVTNLRLPSLETYSFVFEGSQWQYSDWFGGAILGIAHLLFGVTGLVLLKFVTMFIVYFLTARTFKKGQTPFWLTLAGLLSIFFCLKTYSLCRPQLLAFSLLTMMLFCLNRPRQSHLKTLAILFLLQLVWTNVHRSALLGPFLIGSFALAGDKSRRPVYITATAIATFALLINPTGLFLISSTSALLKSPEMRQLIIEWQELTLTRALFGYGPLWITWLLLVGCFVKDRVAFKNYACPEYVFGFALTLAGLHYPRFLPFAALVFVPKAWIQAKTLYGMWPGHVVKALCLVLVSVILLSWVSPKVAGPLRWAKPGLGLDPKFPSAAATVIKKETTHARIFNQLSDGGYLIYRLRNHSQILIDGRTGILYPYDFLEEVAFAVFDRDSVLSLLEKYEANMALLPQIDPDHFNSILGYSKEWPVVFVGDYHVLHARRDFLEINPDLKELVGVNLEAPFRTISQARNDEPTFNQLKLALDSYLSIDENQFKPTVLRAFVAHIEGDQALKSELLDRAEMLNPNYKRPQ